MPFLPSILLGLGVLHVLHDRLNIGFVPTFIVGMVIAAACGYSQRQRDLRRQERAELRDDTDQHVDETRDGAGSEK